MVERILMEQGKKNLVRRAVDDQAQEETLQDTDDQVTLSRAEYEALLQNMASNTRARDEEKVDEDRIITDYLRIQAEKSKDSTDLHSTTIVKKLRKG